ncbi:MAG: hypothetical protein CL760_07405 [Chloroflexi bacterium]|nr:hypothetical protein [Chloroflexota bacterium]|tara:strand:+ start:2163 stop:3932 length:1770 start_codon:yes stop_codon:yes gene_type:complete
MKKNLLSLSITAFLLLPVSSFAEDFAVIVKKSESKYDHKPVSVLPGDKEGVPASVLNVNTGLKDSGDIIKETLSIEAEDGDSIEIESSVVKSSGGDLTISGIWSSNVSLNFTKNDKTGTEFVVPDYDGDIFVTLKITDGLYEKTLHSIVVESEHWVAGTPEYSEWTTTNVVQDWSPAASTVYENTTVEQTKITDRERTRQDKEERPSTGETRDIGSPVVETETNYTETQTVQGTMAYWESTDPYVVQDWTVTEVFQDWNPDASTVYENTTIDQSREVKKERKIIEQEIRPATGEIRQVGSQKTDTTVVTEYRTVQGKLEYWINTGEVSCTDWVFDRNEAWIPDASNYDRDESVNQERKVYESRECSGEQYRPATDEYRYADGEVEYRESTETRTVYGTKIDLNEWFTTDSNGAWSVSNDGTYAYQAINGNNTIFQSKATTYGNTTIKGRMRVRASGGDDDFIGMVFGKTSESDFYLWSWKKLNQSINGGVSYEGHYLAHVTGGVGAINWFMEKDKSGYDALDSLISTSIGWNHDIYYNFEIKYTPTKIEVWVEGTKVLEASGAFPAGQIGFFNLSQGQVEYYKVVDEQF